MGLLSSYNMNRHEVEAAVDRIRDKDGWMTAYNVHHQYSSPWRVHESMKSIAYLPGALKTLEQQLAKSLAQFYDSATVNEWLEQHIMPLESEVDNLMKMARILTEKSVWPRRPLEALEGKDAIHGDDPLKQMPKRR